MPTTYITNPYFDDFSEDKNFHRILFKPGFAVQARELNQLQTILQDQIAKFGKHFFKEGSQVIPGNSFLDRNFNFVKLEPQFASVDIDVDNYLDRFLVGQTSGVRAKVIKVEDATTTDPPTLFVKYVDSGTNKTTSSFAAGETITTYDAGTSFSATVGSSTPTGKCVAVVINDGVYFTKDNFVKVALQTLILDKYSSNSTYKVGLSISETLVNSDDDPSLLDPAINTFNYFAPGADRYKITLTLAKRAINDTTTSDTFIELLRVENGQLVDFVRQPGYNILADELARRTFDESGDYTVNPFKLSFIEHLKDNVNVNGYLTSANGGNTDLAIAVVKPGKAYVKGYEVETIANKYLIFDKPRDTANIENAIIRTPFGNYVNVDNTFGIPNFTSDLITLNLYNTATSVKGTPSGTLVGNVKVRGIEIDSSNVMLDTSSFKLFVFDTEMNPGYTFERDVKQVYHASVSDGGYVSNTFSADIVTTGVALSGTVSLTNASNTVTGVNTFFNTQLKVGDYVKFTSDTANSYRVDFITDNTSLYLTNDYPLSTVSGVTATREEAVIQDGNLSTYVFPFPNSAIENLSDITTRTRRVHYGTLASGNIDLSTAVGTTFASLGTGNYYAALVTGNGGQLFEIESGNFEFTDAPTNRNIRIKLGAGGSPNYGLTNEDILIYSTVIKSNPTQKTKTETVGTITYTSKEECQLPVIPLGHADVFQVSNVLVSANAFGTAFNTDNATDITDSYDLDTGQTATFYDLSKLVLKTNASLPAGPIRVNYKYYAHGSGDYFSAESYPDYDNIPTFINQGITYNLRDSIDFRPRISNSGVNFKDTGASRNEFLDYSNDFQTDYSFYLPRTDKVYITSNGEMTYRQGVSSINPVEPPTPTNAMPLYVIELPAYLFDTENDPTVTPVDQKRYTMRDIGKLDNRIKNLEYYTTLSLLELDTAVFSIKDRFGLDRFKNGFIVDNFRTHGVGDVRNPEHNISMDFVAGELKPVAIEKNVKLSEVNNNDAQRTSDGYKLLSNSTIMLNYTDEVYADVNQASTNESITPYDNFVFTGSMTLTPPGDTWFDETEKPIVYKNTNNEYDTLIPDAVGERTYGTIWNSWKKLWYDQDNEDRISSIDQGAVVTEASVTNDAKIVVLPFIRSATIKFNASNLKPNTKYFAFFNEYNVTDYCYSGSSNTLAVAGFNYEDTNKANIITDSAGVVEGTFVYDPNITGLKIPTGSVVFRLTDSSTNSASKESFADAVYVADGSLVKREKKVVNETPLTGVNLVGSDLPAAADYTYTQILISYLAGTDSSKVDWNNSKVREIVDAVSTATTNYLSERGITSTEFTTTYNPATLITGGLDIPSIETGGGSSAINWAAQGLNATNILTISSGGNSYLDDFQQELTSVGGQGAWDSAVASWSGTVASINATLGADGAGFSSLSQDAQDFWNDNYAPSWDGSAATVNAAIEAYAAQTTVGYFSGNGPSYSGFR